MTKGNLIPKQIVNAKGVHTTVYVRPDQAQGLNDSPLRQVGLPTSASTGAHARAEDPEVIQLGERAGVKMQITVLDEAFPFDSTDTPVFAQIELPDGTVVKSYDYGNSATHTYKDGVEVRSWIHPQYSPSGWEDDYDEQNASHLITSEQFKALNDANEFASQFFSEEIEEAHELSRAQVLEMVHARFAKEKAEMSDSETGQKASAPAGPSYNGVQFPEGFEIRSNVSGIPGASLWDSEGEMVLSLDTYTKDELQELAREIEKH